MEVTTRKLTRAQLAEFLPNHRAIVAFETTQDDVMGMGDALSTGQFVTLSQDDNLGSERVLTGSDNISITDLGPMQPVILDLTDTDVVADTYGDASSVIQIVVDAKGRLVSVEAFALNSDNVTEGSVNLFFTEQRARDSISGAGQIDYDSTTGVIDTTGSDATLTKPVTGLTCNNGVITAVSEEAGAFTGTVSPVTSITVANGIVTAVS
jgi:hypothetical protein